MDLGRTRALAAKHGGRFPVVVMPPPRPGAPSIRVRRRERPGPMHIGGMHGHRFYSLLFVVTGTGHVGLLDGDLAVAPGDIHLLFPGEVHDTAGLTRVRGWVVEFTADAIGEPAGHGFFGLVEGRPRWVGLLHRSGPRNRLVHTPPSRRGPLGMLFANLERELREEPIGHRETARARLQIALVDVLRQVLPESAPAALSPLTESVLDVIEHRFDGALSLASLAREVGRSAAHVSDVLRRETGLSVLEWITERRMEDARRRLRDTDEDVAIVAERVGYGSTNHFIRQFRRAHGVTPGEWRRRALTHAPRSV